jgi:hypothetical protein
MSEKVRQEHSDKQVQSGEKWHKTEFGLLIPNLGVTAHRSVEKTPDFDNNNLLQHSNESASSEKGGQLEAKDREQRYDDSEWFTPPKDVEFDTLARNSIEDRFEDAIDWVIVCYIQGLKVNHSKILMRMILVYSRRFVGNLISMRTL